MGPGNFKAYQGLIKADLSHKIMAHHVPVPERESTLMVGYVLDRTSVHVYHSGHYLHYVTYDYNDRVLMHTRATGFTPGQVLFAQKRWFPERTSQWFALQLHRGGQSACFTTFNYEAFERLQELRFKAPVCVGCELESEPGEGAHEVKALDL